MKVYIENLFLKSILSSFAITLFVLLTFSTYTYSQMVTILPSGITPVVGNNHHPRLTYDNIVALPNPQKGDIAYDLTFSCLRVYNGSSWVCTFQNPSDSSPNIAALTYTTNSYNYPSGVTVDNNGNIYIIALFQNTSTLDTITLTSSAPQGDAYIAKFNSSGSIQWAKIIQSDYSSFGSCISLDSNGNIYIGGNFGGIADFGGIIKSASNIDAFIAKYDNDGTLQWVKTYGGNYQNSVNSICTDSNGNIFVTGYYTGTADFGGTLFTSSGDYDIFVLKYNSSGVIQWVKTAGGTNTDLVLGIGTDATGNVYVAGRFKGTATFGTITKTSAGNYDIFVAKYNSIGTIQWVQAIGGVNNDDARAIVVDSNGNSFVTGGFSGTVSFGTISKTANPSAFFIAKFNSNGVANWVQSIDGAGGLCMSLDANGNVYTSGSFSGTITLGNNSKTSEGISDVFIAKYDNNGIPIWLQSAGGKNIDGGTGIAISSDFKIFLTGFYSLKARFGTTYIGISGTQNFFLARIQE